MKRDRLPYISGFLLALFIFFQASISLFTHTHIVDGATIVHSHPGAEGHQHNGQQFVTIALASHITFDEVQSVNIEKAFQSVCEIFALPDAAAIISNDKCVVSLRAPPVSC